MLGTIFTKLSPLSKQDFDYYAKTISQINFKADTKFCSLAKLACSSWAVSLNRSPNHLDAPPTKMAVKVYNVYAGASTTSLDKIDPFSFFSAAAIKGEFKSSPNSLEKMINISKITLGANKLLALTSKNTAVPSSRIYVVDLIEPTTQTPVNTALAVCHMDTSSWPQEHVVFKILKFRPGQGEARLATG
ncbi:hypothetical protein C2S51_020844 [Perilla frutescens var. frutescens]|nr:hypothetical protein C2S51_020844 [Perilla frutescens var. frutescens]